MRNPASTRPRIAAFLIALAVLATPALLFAHARLLRSTPPANATLSSLPTSLTLWFSEKPELKFTSITLTDSAGATVALGPVASTDSNGVTLPITGTLKAGRYAVAWRTAASDGHATSGTYRFAIGASAAALGPPPSAAADTTTPTAQPESTITVQAVSNSLITTHEPTPVSTAMRWAELVALLTIVGIVILRLAVLPKAGWSPELLAVASDRAARLGRAVLVLLAIATLSRAFAEATLLPGLSDSRLEALQTLISGTRWGAAWAVGAIGVVVVFIGLMLAGRMFAGWATAAVGLVVIAVSQALTGHSSSVHNAAAAVAADVAHLLGAGGWLGGLTAVLLCALPALKRASSTTQASEAGAGLIRAYHNTALECVVVVVLSAIVAAWVRFPSVSSIWTTPYGLALLRKTIFVVVVLGFGFYHWRRVVIPAWTADTLGRFRRSALAELLFGAIVVALTAYLLTQPLPR